MQCRTGPGPDLVSCARSIISITSEHSIQRKMCGTKGAKLAQLVGRQLSVPEIVSSNPGRYTREGVLSHAIVRNFPAILTRFLLPRGASDRGHDCIWELHISYSKVQSCLGSSICSLISLNTQRPQLTPLSVGPVGHWDEPKARSEP